MANAHTPLHWVNSGIHILFGTAALVLAWEQFDGEGVLQQSERAERSMATMLAHLR